MNKGLPKRNMIMNNLKQYHIKTKLTEEVAMIEQEEPKTLNNITIYDLGGEDHNVWLTKNKNTKEFSLTILNEQGEEFIDKQLHEYAAESLALFCKHYLKAYERAIK